MSSLGTLGKNLSIPFISSGSSDSDSEGGGGERDEREDKSEASSLAILVAEGGMNAPVLIFFSRVLVREGAFGVHLLLLKGKKWPRSRGGNKAKLGPHTSTNEPSLEPRKTWRRA